jgi:hypothetical protein
LAWVAAQLASVVSAMDDHNQNLHLMPFIYDLAG